MSTFIKLLIILVIICFFFLLFNGNNKSIKNIEIKSLGSRGSTNDSNIFKKVKSGFTIESEFLFNELSKFCDDKYINILHQDCLKFLEKYSNKYIDLTLVVELARIFCNSDSLKNYKYNDKDIDLSKNGYLNKSDNGIEFKNLVSLLENSEFTKIKKKVSEIKLKLDENKDCLDTLFELLTFYTNEILM